jgi:hypothetical protein
MVLKAYSPERLGVASSMEVRLAAQSGVLNNKQHASETKSFISFMLHLL